MLDRDLAGDSPGGFPEMLGRFIEEMERDTARLDAEIAASRAAYEDADEQRAEDARAGKLGPVARLLPTTAATTLRKVKGESVVIDGPFAETKEQFLGFYTIDCADLDEAVAFARELSEVNPSGGSYEIRPVSVFNRVQGEPLKVTA